MKKHMKTIWRIALAIFLVCTVVVIACNTIVKVNASDKIYDSVSDIPHNRVALLL